MNIEFIRCGDRINDSNKKNVRKVSTFACTQLAVSWKRFKFHCGVVLNLYIKRVYL